MAITTYSELVTAIENHTHRDDLTARIPEFIAQAEQDFWYGTDPIRVSAMQNRDTGTTSSGSITLPTGYLETIRLVSTTGGVNYNIDYLSPNAFTQYEALSGIPKFYTLLAGEIKTAPTNDVSYIHDYYKKLDALTALAPTNWLITNAPNIYLYGALLKAAPYLKDDNRIMVWQQLYASSVAGVNKADKSKFESASMYVVTA